MKKKRYFNRNFVDYLLLFIFIVFILVFLIFMGDKFTGFAIYETHDQTGFDQGIYNNTKYNGSAVVLSGENLSGTYISEIFDVGDNAYWNNLSWESSEIGELLDNTQGNLMGANVLLLHMNNNWLDTSGEGNNGVSNGAIFTTSSKLGTHAGSFDGNDYVLINQSSTTDLVNDFTIATWLNPDGFTGRVLDNNNRYGIYYDGSWERIISVGNAAFKAQSSSYSVPADSWTFVVLVYDSVNGHQIYINGEPDGSNSYNLDITNHGDLYIGKYATSYYQGKIDELVIWNRMLSEEEIKDIYRRGILKLNLTSRSCDDSACLGESYVDIADVSPQNLSLSNNQYFQYKAYFLTDNSDYSPELYNVSIDYTVLNSAPIINLIEPQNQLYTENESLALNYTVYDNDNNLDSCWYNINNGENITLINCENTTFDVSEGNHNITIYANDSLGLKASDFVEFNVDASGISLSISEPIGTKTSRIGIPLIYSVIGNNVFCWYNVKTSVGGEIIGNTSLENCSASSFSVSTDGDYVLNLYANNTLGSFDFESSAFSVDTSTVIINSGGGGGGRTTIISGLTDLEISNLSNLVVYPGDSKKLSLKAKNIGTSILNECYVVEKGNSNFWILSNEVKNLASGEIYDFVFDLTISEIIEVGKYDLEVVLKCQEINKSADLIVEIIDRKLNFEILDVERLTEEEVRVKYSLEELSNINQEIEIQFLLFDFEGKKIAEVQDVKGILANSKQNSEILIPIEPSLEGEIRLLVNLNSETYSTFVSEDIILGAPISGLSIFGNSGQIDRIASVFIILLFLIGAFFIIRRILRHRKKITKGKKKLKSRKKKFDFKPFS